MVLLGMLAEFSFSLLIALPTIVVSLLSLTELWQRKEYRWDRLQSYLRGPDGRYYIRSWLLPATLCAAAGWIAYLLFQDTLAALLGWGGLLSFLLYHLFRMLRRGLLRPQFTAKALLILIGSAGLTFVYWALTFIPTQFPALQWATLLLFLPLLVASTVGLVNIPAYLRKRQIIGSATRLRQKLSGLTVIGITGSYGKTSTKFFLKQILAGDKRLVKATKAHRNSEIGVALDMLEQLTANTNIYIAEMGAYQRGEIRALSTLTRPQIGILTAIGNQHIELFGSRANITQTKWELIEALPKDGVAILNKDDKLIRQQAEKYSGRILWYSLKEKADVYATSIAPQPASIRCHLYIARHAKQVTIPLASRGLLSGVLAAIAAALAAGEEPARIYRALTHLKPFPRTMEITPGYQGATIIDDSYSANETGVINALAQLALFPNRDKRVVMVPLIELGVAAPAAHQRVGQALAKSRAKIYWHGQAYVDDIKKGIHQVEPLLKFHVLANPQSLFKAVTKNITSETVILLEGRVPEIIRQTLRAKK